MLPTYSPHDIVLVYTFPLQAYPIRCEHPASGVVCEVKERFAPKLVIPHAANENAAEDACEAWANIAGRRTITISDRLELCRHIGSPVPERMNSPKSGLKRVNIFERLAAVSQRIRQCPSGAVRRRLSPGLGTALAACIAALALAAFAPEHLALADGIRSERPEPATAHIPSLMLFSCVVVQPCSDVHAEDRR
ncbi:hypothetical protein SAMN04488557_2169 [Hyphomicrobium facile]|uniref:Uncharacterized protein n=1 Tax=Hyphomicrobium facile TaxID=51670 RepID=A0A1I7NH33_9HYPH|nr:hypothetical protein SAMN04488557_2169 [Hyphomicrobium facile]